MNLAIVENIHEKLLNLSLSIYPFKLNCSFIWIYIFYRPKQLLKIQQLSAEEQDLLLHRCELDSISEEDVICLHHKKVFLDLYSSLQKKCCNPFNLHQDVKRKGLRPVTSALAEELKMSTVKAGMKICTKCRLYKHRSEPLDLTGESQSDDIDTSDAEYVSYQDKEKQLNESITCLGISPCKMSSVSTRDKIAYAKRKLKQVKQMSTDTISSCAKVLATDLESPMKGKVKTTAESDIEYLVEGVKSKINISSKGKIIALLSLAPHSWSISRTVEEFNVSEYMVRKARQLQKEHGILPEVPSKIGKPLSDETIKKVISFYNDDDISRVMPGSKDFKSVKEGDTRIHKQKRLLLMNLNEAYELFKQRYPGHEVGLSKFCELRPKECVTVGARGTHSVCVCTIHQNVKLMLSKFPTTDEGNISYHDLLDHLVCSTENALCMLHRCENCPGLAGLHDFLMDKISDEVDQIIYKQWISTDRTYLTDQIMTSREYIETLIEKTDKLASHHFIAKHQAKYLRSLKQNLSRSECIVLLDFAENYSFLVQDAAQGYHWDNSQCTLHPCVIYFRVDQEERIQQTNCASVCIISDCLKHDTTAVHTFLSELIPYIHSLSPEITKVFYFSDGSAAQYKNHKNFTNLMKHHEDFGISAEWHFFATSHGKSPCDGIGGTVKREAARSSLQATTSNHILTPMDLFSWAERHIINIHFIWISKEKVLKMGKNLEKRFSKSTTIPGTRDNHSFIPVSPNYLQVSRFSGDPGFILDMSGNRPQIKIPTTQHLHDLDDMIPGTYVACIYDQHWWIGNIREVSELEKDIHINFMHPHGPSKNFKWPRREDICWVPLAHIIKVIDAPSTTTGRQYQLKPKEEKELQDLFKVFIQ